jgi:hypothetical protein
MFKVYIEESALNEPQPMEVSPDAPVSRLVPALVEELQLPRTDLFGNRLVYFLRHTDDGRVLPDHFSLRTAGIADEDCLSLESYVAEGAAVLATPSRLPTGQAATFYADQTIADATAFAGAKGEVGPPLAPSPLPPQRPFRRNGRRWTRRALLTVGGVTLGLAGIGLAYAGLHTLSNGPATNGSAQGTMFQGNSTMPAQTKNQPTPAQAFVPAHAQVQQVFKQHQQTVRAVAWSPDGKLLASGGNDQQLLVWNTSGQVQFNAMQRAAIRAVAWSADAQHLACASAARVLLFNGQSGVAEGQGMNAHHGLVMALAWSARQPSLLVSGGLDRQAIVWNTQNFQPMTTFRQHTTGILAVSWAADGQTVGSSSLGGVTRIWNGGNGQQVHGFYEILDQGGNGVALNALAFQPVGNMLAAAGMDGIVRLWSNGLACQMMGTGATQGQCIDMPQSLSAHTRPLRALAWSPDGRFLATGGDDNMLRVWYPARSQSPLLNLPQDAPVLALAWSPDGKMLAVASGRNITLLALS